MSHIYIYIFLILYAFSLCNIHVKNIIYIYSHLLYIYILIKDVYSSHYTLQTKSIFDAPNKTDYLEYKNLSTSKCNV